MNGADPMATANPDPLDASNWSIVTPTYGADFAQFELLNESVLRHAPGAIEHVVVTDRQDLALFEPLRHDRMRLHTKEDVLPGRVRRVERSSKQVWVSTHFPPVRGWIAQQMVKIEAATTLARPYVLFVDSDVVFLRDWDISRFCSEDRVGLLQVADRRWARPEWRAAALKLFRRELTADPAPTNYVSNIVPWRRDIARDMVQRMETGRSGRWTTRVALTPRFSEYTCYGVYCTEIVGLHTAGHATWADPLLNDIWEPDLTVDRLRETIASTRPEQIAAMVHSKSSFDRDALSDAVREFWASTDGPTS